MPRTGRGGARTGTPGKNYTNRSDLNTNRGALPVMAATGQQYGKATAQREAQRALPMGAPPPPAVGPVASSPATGPTVPGQLPGQLVPLDAPSQRPNEPVTAGVPVGAGGGPELLGRLAQSEDGVEDLAMYLPMLEFIASQPGTSAQTRNFVRRLRGAAPVT